MISKIVPCTLCSGHYHFGAGALANSLYRRGFRGKMYVGYQPPLPSWAKAARRNGDCAALEIEPEFSIEFIPWPSRHVLSLEKANFLVHILDKAAPDAEAALLFDADVVIRASWQFFENWVREGVALCLDVCYPLVPSGHPWRRAWRDLAAAEGHGCRPLDYYAAGAFVGVPRVHREFARCWAALIARYLAEQPHIIDRVKFNEREDPFVGDQDMLNAAMMATAVPLSIIGQEGMDFTPAGFVMSAAIDARKPWQKNFLLSALGGSPPRTSDRMYWHFADAPIPLFSKARLISSRAAIRAASAIGRFYSRN